MACDLRENRRRIMMGQPHLAAATGRMVSIAPKAALPLKHLVVSFSGLSSLSVLLMTNNVWNTESEFENGYYNDSGVLQSSTATGHSTSYVPVEASTSYKMVGEIRPILFNSTGGVGVYLWDSSKAWIERQNYMIQRNEIYTQHSFTTTAGCAYITTQAPVGPTKTSAGYDEKDIRISKVSDIQTFTADWTSIGTLYDGTIDLATGTLTGAATSGGTQETYQITGQTIIPVVGESHFWSDAGNISLTYWTH